jgi:fatty acid desaturase
LTLIALGVFFFIQDSNPDLAASLGWLPLTSLCIYIISFALGFGPIPWLLMSEVLSKEVGTVVGPICGAFNWFLAFLITLTFSPISHAIGIGPTFWIFAVISLLGIFFVFLIVPETKGKSMAEIQRMLSGESDRSVDCQ